MDVTEQIIGKRINPGGGLKCKLLGMTKSYERHICRWDLRTWILINSIGDAYEVYTWKKNVDSLIPSFYKQGHWVQKGEMTCQ